MKQGDAGIAGKTLSKILNGNIGDYLLKRGTIVGMLVLILVLGIRAPVFFDVTNLMDVLKQGGVLTLIAISQTVVLISGGFDMSAGALLQLTSNLAAGFILANRGSASVIGLGVMIGAVAGLFNALMVVYVKIPSFVATLSSMLIMTGATLFYNDGKSITLYDKPGFFYIGQGYIGGVIPVLFLIVLVIMSIVHLFLKYTKTGLHMYSVGENIQAALIRGINPRKAVFLSFIIAGILVGFTGVLQTSYNYGASAMTTGMDFLMSALAASLMGTTYSKTGELSVIGTAISAIFISSLSSALIANGVSNMLQPGLLGLVLIASILLTVIKKREIGQISFF